MNLIENIIKGLGEWDELIEQAQAEIDAAGTGGRADNFSRTVVHDDRYIYIKMKKQNVSERVSYTPDLFLFLTNRNLCSFSCRPLKKYRVYVELLHFKRAGVRCAPSLGFFAHYYYKSGLPAERFMLNVPKIMAEKRGLNLEIDHVNSHFHDHAWWNLSEMTKRENQVKNNIAAKIKPPYYCFLASMPNGDYRVECGWVMPFVRDGDLILTGQKYFVSCKDNATLISFLKSFVAYCESVQKSTIKDYFAGSFEAASRAAEKLVVMDDNEFYPWSIDSEWTHISSMQNFD